MHQEACTHSAQRVLAVQQQLATDAGSVAADALPLADTAESRVLLSQQPSIAVQQPSSTVQPQWPSSAGQQPSIAVQQSSSQQPPSVFGGDCAGSSAGRWQ